MAIITIDTKSRIVNINSQDKLAPSQVLQELALGEDAIKTCAGNFLAQTGAYLIPVNK